MYHYFLISGLGDAWRGGASFEWDELFDLMLGIAKSDEFWSEEYPRDRYHYDYKRYTIHKIAEIIEHGTSDDNHAFAPELLPQAENILLILARRTESYISEPYDVSSSILGSAKGQVFMAMVNYSLRVAKVYIKAKEERWAPAIKEDFFKRLDRDFEPSIEFSLMLGQYLYSILYLDDEWVISNVDRIFPKENVPHWKAAFAAYLYYSGDVCRELYMLLRNSGHYARAIETEFNDDSISRELVRHICTGYVEGWDNLVGHSSLIHKLIESKKPNHLSNVMYLFWMQRDKLNDKIKSRLKPLWGALFQVLSFNEANPEYQKEISELSRWLSLIDEIDNQIFEWLKLSSGYAQSDPYFIEYLSKHVEGTPVYVAELLLDCLSGLESTTYLAYRSHNSVGHIVETLYEVGQREYADRICNICGEKGYDFLRELHMQHKLGIQQ